MRSICRQKVRRAFSLIEFVVVIAIMLAILVFMALGLSSFRRSGFLNQGVQAAVSALRSARIRTISSQNLSPWGVHFSTSSQLTIFEGSSFSATSGDNEVINLPYSVVISNVSVASSSGDVVFLRPQGNTNNFGDVTISWIDGTSPSVIHIDASGVIAVASSASVSVSNPNQDTRHVHVPLGFDIRARVNLILVFHRPPLGDLTDTTPISSCMVAADMFDCTRSVMVDGSVQTIRVSSHAIDAASTLLSINRDRRFNDKAVDVYFDATLIVSYSDSGLISKGPDVLVGEPQIQ